MKKILSTIAVIFLIGTVVSNAQDITNTLAPNGNFKIKDGSTDYLSLTQTTGNLTLFRNLELGGVGNSTSIIGVITKNGERFIHNYLAPNSSGLNTFIGTNSGNFTMGGSLSNEGSYNTAVGVSTLTSLTTGYSNCAFGLATLRFNTTGYYNSAFGNAALNINSSGYNNSAFGFGAMQSNAYGNSNSAFGISALRLNSSGNNNTAFGDNSLYSNIASNNSAFGSQSLYNNTTGMYNSAFGFQSLYTNSTGNNNSAFGFTSLFANTTGNQNSAFGISSLRNNSTGSFNSGFGYLSLYNNTTGYENCAFGSGTMHGNTTGSNNTALGYNSLLSNITGFNNTAVGHHSLQNNTGNYNTAIGYNAGSNVTTGENLTLIGIDANPSSPTVNDQITLGNQFVSSLRCNVQTITSLSDARDKKNIKDLTLGLDFITKLKPRQFNWDRRDWYKGGISDSSKMQETPTAGFIAQEFDEAQNSEHAEWLNLVLKDNPDKWEATYGNLLPVMVKAIQELAIKNEELKIEKDKEITRLSAENLKLKSDLEKLMPIKEGLSEIKSFKEELMQQISELKSVQKEYESKFSSLEN